MSRTFICMTASCNCAVSKQSAAHSEQKLSTAKTPCSKRGADAVEKGLQSTCRCSVVVTSVPLTDAKLRALQTRQRKASLVTQKQRLCGKWAQQLHWRSVCRLVAWRNKQAAPLRWIASLLLPTKSQTLPKAESHNRLKRQIVLAERAGMWTFQQSPWMMTEAST